MTLPGWEEIKHFKPEEFNCKCCGFNNMDIAFVKELDFIREQIDAPLEIVSGARCEKHNKEVGGKPDSAHLRGLAVDIKILTSRTRFVFLALAVKRFKRIGIGSKFIHIDKDPNLPQYVTWLYNTNGS